MVRKMIVEVVADCLPQTMFCECEYEAESGNCVECLNISNELVNNLWAQGFQVSRVEVWRCGCGCGGYGGCGMSKDA